MENENYQKDFKPLLIWLIVFMVGMNGFPMLVKMFPSMTSGMQTKLSIFLLFAAVLILYFIVYKGEYVYYLPGGPTITEAKKAGSEKRKEYAKKSFVTMLRSAMMTLIFMVISLFLGLSGFYDWVVAAVLVVTAAVTSSKEKKVFFAMEQQTEEKTEE